jgi:hypothetical protein
MNSIGEKELNNYHFNINNNDVTIKFNNLILNTNIYIFLSKYLIYNPFININNNDIIISYISKYHNYIMNDDDENVYIEWILDILNLNIKIKISKYDFKLDYKNCSDKELIISYKN